MDRPMIQQQPNDGIERGMLFHFINANIENQYEFVLRQWVNDSEFAGAVRLHPDSRDPLTGTQDPAESIFVIPQADGSPPIEVTGLVKLRYDEGGGVRVSAQHHSHSSHRQTREKAADAASDSGSRPAKERLMTAIVHPSIDERSRTREGRT